MKKQPTRRRKPGELEGAVRRNIERISPDTLVIAENLAIGRGKQRVIDIVGLTKEAELVAIRFRRSDGEAALTQCLLDGSTLSSMTFRQLCKAYGARLAGGTTERAQDELLKFLEWDSPPGDAFPTDVVVVLASDTISPDLKHVAAWLDRRGIKFRCIRVQRIRQGGRAYVEIQTDVVSESDEARILVPLGAYTGKQNRPGMGRKKRPVRRSGRGKTAAKRGQPGPGGPSIKKSAKGKSKKKKKKRRSHSVYTVSGGLPGLGKRR